MYWKDSVLLRFYLSQDVWVVKVALQLASWQLVAYKPVNVKVLVLLLCTELIGLLMSVLGQKKIKLLSFLLHLPFFISFLRVYEKCNQKNVKWSIMVQNSCVVLYSCSVVVCRVVTRVWTRSVVCVQQWVSIKESIYAVIHWRY